MASYRFALAKNDFIWAFTMPPRPEVIQQLLDDPIAFVHRQPQCESVRFSRRAGDPLTLVFQYGLDGDDFLVHGVEFTNLISVRGPKLPRLKELNPVAGDGFIRVDDPTIQVKRLEKPRISYAHFDPTEPEGQTLSNTARILANPRGLVDWLNDQAQDPDPLKVPSAAGSTPVKDDKTTQFVGVSDGFRFTFQKYPMPAILLDRGADEAAVDGGEDDGEDDTPDVEAPQCVKISGSYDEDDTTDQIDVIVDEGRQLRWVSEEEPGDGLPPILIPG